MTANCHPREEGDGDGEEEEEEEKAEEEEKYNDEEAPPVNAARILWAKRSSILWSAAKKENMAMAEDMKSGVTKANRRRRVHATPKKWLMEE